MELRIAVVQDCRADGKVAAQLQEAGYRTVVVGSACEAAGLLEQRGADVILLDLSAFDVLAFVRLARGRWPQLIHRIAAIAVLPDTIARFCPEIAVSSAGSLASDLNQLIDRTLISAGSWPIGRESRRPARLRPSVPERATTRPWHRPASLNAEQISGSGRAAASQ